ncbi:MAG TPA: S-adenosylmethionine tRNA ribosyltransferase [Bacteroidetes bacterium]|nr:S-adenosylmethionine tRNA ribosyltransferase [Bacteroidota bacterium]
MIKKSDFFFELADEQIAKYPLAERDQSKLLVQRKGKTIHSAFSAIGDYLDKNTLLVMNNAKVIPARLYFKRESGAAIEVLLLEPSLPANYEEAFNTKAKCRWKCIIGNSKKWKDEEYIKLADNPTLLSAKLIDRQERIVELSWESGQSFTDLLDTIGELPLPPYLNRATEESDTDTYQTVFAKNAGSVAAPTAGLHFTANVFSGLREKGVELEEVTLHVGAGTFLPVKEDNVVDHDMHREHFEITIATLDTLIAKPTRVCVGTTSMRVLESMYWLGIQLSKGNTSLLVHKLEPYETQSDLSYEESLSVVRDYMNTNVIQVLQAATEILILPHYKPRSIIGLITNFHLPESTLLMLIASVVGDSWRQIYEEAKRKGYRFLSYGDSSLLFTE